MGTTMQKIQAIADSKDAIKDAIEEQGVTVGDAKLSEYPSKIRAIQGGGSSDAVLYTPQTLTSSQQAQARENIGAGEDNVFIAEYGVTPQADIEAALTAGKAVLCTKNDAVYMLTGNTTNWFNFTYISAGNEVFALTYYKPRGTWGTSSSLGEKTSNKVTSLSASSTDTQYPSAKCVADMVAVWGVVSQTQTWTQASDGGYDYVMSELQYGWIPKMFVDLVTTAGATFNSTSGYFEFNGLTDISYKEMMLVYQKNLTDAAKNVSSFFQGGYGKNTGVLNSDVTRTNIATWCGTWNQKLVCTQISMASPLEVFRYASVDNMYMNANCSWAFQASNHLKALVPIVNVSDVTSFNGTFGSLPSFEECQLKGLKIALSIPNSPRFKASAVAYMINNAANTSAITITLHATAYARAIADSDVQAALQAHPTITLASA